MRLVQFRRRDAPLVARSVGVELADGGAVVDISHIASSSLQLLEGGKEAEWTVRNYLATSPPTVDPAGLVLEAPITNMDKVICIGMNYIDHIAEQGGATPTEPLVFNKFPSCVAGPTEDLPHPKNTKKLDWEVELTVVIGTKCRDVDVDTAMNHVFGYTVAHDVSARDWQLQRNGGQWLVGKAMDKFCPIGPAIVTSDEIEDPHNLKLSCTVNGKVRQSSSTGQLLFGVGELVSWVSKLTTLLPGDLILTGTPPGVGAFMKPPQFLAPGDLVECWVEGIGTIANRVV